VHQPPAARGSACGTTHSPAVLTVFGTPADTGASVCEVTARNIKRVGDVDKSRPGTFLFNYFVGENPQVVLELWDYLAGWYQVETGLDNSTVLAPLEGEASNFIIINHARWDGSLVSVLAKQSAKKSFRSYVLGNP
jgi:hypothetical protein